MEHSQKSLLEVVEDQKRTIEKYTNKLRDVVAAHKSLLVEKKALEDTINILNAEKANTVSPKNENEKEAEESNVSETSESDLKKQLNSVVTSLSNLVAEKSRMEEGFKSSQKQLLEDKKKVENKCEELEEQVKVLTRQLKSVENKNTEFSNSVRTTKNSKQTTDSKDKSKTLDNELLALQVKNYEKEIRHLKSELEAKQIIYESLEKKLNESLKELSKVQDDIKNLQIEHEMAILKEKEKAKSIEEQAKKLTAIQEERVYNLEMNIAELSETIGTYDRQRLQDQIEIQKLKEHITFIDVGAKGPAVGYQKSEAVDVNDFDTIKEKFLDVKKKLQLAAQKYNKEEDLKNLLFENPNNEEMHLICEEEYKKLKTEFEYFKNEVKFFNQGKSGEENQVILQNQVKNLQGKVKILSSENEEIIRDYNMQIEQLNKTIKNEKMRFKKMISASEADHKAEIWFLEKQLQKQRERSLALLEEKEQEVQALQSTFQMFLPGYKSKPEDEPPIESNLLMKNQFDGPHIVHYANELARRDVEISSLRRSKHETEMTLRELQKELAAFVEKHVKEKQSLTKKIARLERYQTREGVNMEYLKNVVYNLLLSDEPKWRVHFCNALAAVLKFSETELQAVLQHKKKS